MSITEEEEETQTGLLDHEPWYEIAPEWLMKRKG
jgi:hypothetical protein